MWQQFRGLFGMQRLWFCANPRRVIRIWFIESKKERKRRKKDKLNVNIDELTMLTHIRIDNHNINPHHSIVPCMAPSCCFQYCTFSLQRSGLQTCCKCSEIASLSYCTWTEKQRPEARDLQLLTGDRWHMTCGR